MPGKIELHYCPDRFYLTDQFLERYPRLISSSGETLFVAISEERVQHLKKQWILRSNGSISLDFPFRSYHNFLQILFSQLNIPGRFTSFLEKCLILKNLVSFNRSRWQYFVFPQGSMAPVVINNLVNFFDKIRLNEASSEILKNTSRRLVLSTSDKLQEDLRILFSQYQAALKGDNTDEAELLIQMVAGLNDEFLRQYYPDLQSIIFEDISHFSSLHIRLVKALKDLGLEIYLLLPYGTNPEIFSHKEQLFNRVRTIADHLRGYPGVKKLSNTLFQVKSRSFDFQPNIQVAPATSRLREVEYIAAQIKKQVLLSDQVSSSIAVTGPRLEPYQPLLRTVFNRYKIPYSFIQGRSIHSSILIRHLELYLKLVIEDYPVSHIQKLFQSPYLKYRDRLMVEDLPLLFSRMRVKSGKKDILTYLTKTRFREISPPEAEDISNREEIYTRIKKSFKELFREAEFFETDHTPMEFMNKMLTIASDHEMVGKVFQQSGTAQVRWLTENVAALRRLMESLDFWQNLPASGPGITSLDLRTFYEIISMLTQLVTVSERTPSPFGIQIVPLDQVQNRRYETLFILGMEEGEFPGEMPTQFTHPQNIPPNLRVFAREGGLTRDREIFLQLLYYPARIVQFSYPRFHQDKPVLPSPFLRELERISGNSLEVIPDQQLVTRNEVLEKLAGRINGWREGEFDWESLPEPAKSVISPESVPLIKLRTEVIRQRESAPDNAAWEGILTGDPLASSWIKTRFTNTRFSATQLERFALCPIIYFFERLLQISPFEEAEEFLSPMERGKLVHDILYRFYREYKPAQRNGEKLLTVARGELKKLPFVRGLWQELEQEFYLGNDQIKGLFPAFWEYEQHSVLRHRTVPRHFELSFGNFLGPDVPADPASIPHPLEIKDHEEMFYIKGKIDRVEISDGGSLLVVDYKTGSLPSLKDMWNGQRLQLPIYLKAAQSVLKKLYPALHADGGAYYLLRSEADIDKKIIFIRENHGVGEVETNKSVQFPSEKFKTDDMPTSLEDLIDRTYNFAISYIRQIQQGKFPHTDDQSKCREPNGKFCQYLPVCRVNWFKKSLADENLADSL